MAVDVSPSHPQFGGVCKNALSGEKEEDEGGQEKNDVQYVE
jgi:hypothetical protein